VSCDVPSEQVVRALSAAPDPVRLGDVRLSTCLDRAVTGGEIARFGTVVAGAADQLLDRARTSPRAGYELGFLAGAMLRGRSELGYHDDLVRRFEMLGIDDLPPASRAAFRRGLAAGRTTG
jgi:hypothetical protein